MAEASVHQHAGATTIVPQQEGRGFAPGMVLSQRVSGRGQTGGEVAVAAAVVARISPTKAAVGLHVCVPVIGK